MEAKKNFAPMNIYPNTRLIFKGIFQHKCPLSLKFLFPKFTTTHNSLFQNYFFSRYTPYVQTFVKDLHTIAQSAIRPALENNIKSKNT